MLQGNRRKPEITRKKRLGALGRQVFGSLAIGFVIYMAMKTVLQFAYDFETANRIASPTLLYLFALIVFPIVRKYMR